MNIQLLIVFIAILVALYFFYSINRRNRLVKQERKEARRDTGQRRQQIMEQLAANPTETENISTR